MPSQILPKRPRMNAAVVLANTTVISEFVKKTPDAQVMRWLQSVQLMAVSVITLEEAHFGLAWKPNMRDFQGCGMQLVNPFERI